MESNDIIGYMNCIYEKEINDLNNEILLWENMTIEEFLILELTRFAQKYNRNPRVSDLRIFSGYPSVLIYRNYFGSFNNALTTAGLKTNSVVKKNKQAMRNNFTAYDNLMRCINMRVENEIGELNNESLLLQKEIILLHNKIAYLQFTKNTCVHTNHTNLKTKDKRINMCYKCGDITVDGCDHHVVPRSFGGSDVKENLVYLCNKCHDYVEIQTYELLNVNMVYDSRILKLYIKGEFPMENEDEKSVKSSLKSYNQINI